MIVPKRNAIYQRNNCYRPSCYRSEMFKPNFRITARITSALMQIEACRQAIDDLPIDATVLRQLRETAALMTTHFSTQIEGNRLTLPEVRAAIKGERMPGRERDEREVRNHYLALGVMEELSERLGSLSEEDIRRLHGLVMTGRNKPSPYRVTQNVIRDSSTGSIVYLSPEAPDVPELMRSLIEWINAELTDGELPAPIVAALAHYQFATIHPYLDGNGRTTRLLATLILRKAGYGLKGIYSLDEHYAKSLSSYYSALTVGSHNYYDGRADGDVTPFISYFCAGMADAFTKVRTAAARRRADGDRPLDTSARSRTAATPAFGIVSKTGLGDIGRNGRLSRDESPDTRTAQQGMDRERFSRVPKSGAQESFVSIGSTFPPAFFLTGSDAPPPSPASMQSPAIPPLSRPRPRRPWSSSGRCRRPRSCRGA
jgi:Fic family protein